MREDEGLDQPEEGFGGNPTAALDSAPVDADAAGETSAEPIVVIAGFWRRSLAFTIDAALFAVLGLVVGALFFDSLANLGPWGRLIGFVVTLVYFGVFDSSIGRGQTLGKRLMHIHVVGRTGELIAPPRAFARYAVLAAPVFLNQLMLPVSALRGPLTVVISIVIFGLGGASVYLFVFNRRTRQSVHDLVVGSLVTNVESHGEMKETIVRLHLIVVAVWVALSAVALLVSGIFAAKLPPGLYRSIETIEATGDVHTTSIFIGKSWGPDGKVTTYVAVTAVMKRPVSDPRAIGEQMAGMVLRELPEAQDVDFIDVTVARSFDLGFASAYRSSREYRSPDEWKAAQE